MNGRMRYKENPENEVRESARIRKIKFNFENGSASCY